MTQDDCPRVSIPESSPSIDPSLTKQRKKRKWDQPAEPLVSAGVAVHGVLPLGNLGSVSGITIPGVAPVSGASLVNPFSAGYGHLQQGFVAPSIQQHATTLVQKIQPKIQEELIAREIVINDAEPSIRYKLTKRQTQEEIQKCTGAIVITRGKYRPPNAQLDGEKPLYLHVSAGGHLESTAERIKAVDQAAAMVEEILKQGAATSVIKVQPFSTCVFLGFEPDPSLNILARIRGPNDQYVNHIMNETGSTVLLRGRGSGNSECANSEGQQPLHLFLSSSNPKSLEHAKLLSENLLDTICAECGASRVSSCKVYGAVPPPQQLSARTSAIESKGTTPTTAHLTSLTADIITSQAISLVTAPTAPQSSLTHGTSYNGYGGIYPQATPLQQVALALRHSTSPVISTISPTINTISAKMTTMASTNSEKKRQPPHKRKFQELPVASEGHLKPHKESGMLNQNEVKSARTMSSMPAPRKLVQPSSNGMAPPPPKAMPPPPPPPRTTLPPPKFNSPAPVVKVVDTKIVSDTLTSLMEYGDEDDDDIEETDEEPIGYHLKPSSGPKPFWAV